MCSVTKQSTRVQRHGVSWGDVSDKYSEGMIGEKTWKFVESR